MTTEISQDSKVKLSVKTLVAILVLASTLIGFYYSLASSIEEAKQLPKSDVSRQELDLKLTNISLQVIANGEKLNKIENQVEKIEERVYELKWDF